MSGTWRGWSEGMNLDYSEPDSALSSSERRAPIPESQEPNSDLERCNRENINAKVREHIVVYLILVTKM